MSNICLPNTDLASSTPLEVASGRAGTAIKAASTRKAAQEGGRVFRDLLGAMAHKGKAGGGAAAERAAGSSQSQSTAQVVSAAPSAWDKGEAVRDADRVDGIDEEAFVATTAGTQDSAVCALVSALAAGVPGNVALRDGRSVEKGREDEPAAEAGVVAAAAVAASRTSPAEANRPWTVAELHAALTSAADSQSTPAAAPQAADPTEIDPVAADEVVEFRAAAPAKVSVVAQETYFAPVAATGAVDQIADAVMAALPDLAGEAAPAAGPAAAAADTSVDRSPVRVLTVQLDPPELGEVTVNMRLKGDALELRVTAANEDTARLLQTQRDMLSNLMRDTGYDPDIAGVQAADAPAVSSSAAGTQLGANLDQSDSSQPNLAEGRRQNAADRGEDGRDNRRQQTPSERQDRAAADSAPARSSAIYL